MKTRPILFVSHKPSNCGVYEFGRNVAEALSHARVFSYEYVECDSASELAEAVSRVSPVVIIYNYHPTTMAWLTIAQAKRLSIPQIGVMHEVTQSRADSADTSLFDYHVAPDPTLLLRNPRVFKTGRYVPRYERRSFEPEVPTIGSFGFATSGKGFERLVEEVKRGFERAKVVLRIPFARFGDEGGQRAREIARRCAALVESSQIELTVDHSFLSTGDLLNFLAGNSLNAFLYDDVKGRGISSVVDYALAVDRPIAVSSSSMFRHVHDARPSITVGETSLREILANGTRPLERYRAEWTIENLAWDYDRIVRTVLEREQRRPHSFVRSNRTARTAVAMSFAAVRRGAEVTYRLGAPALAQIAPKSARVHAEKLERVGRAVLRRVGYYGVSGAGLGDWVPSAVAVATERQQESIAPYRPDPAQVVHYNRILDDEARAKYKDAIAQLALAAPTVITRKIPAANVQQAFVLDTVARFATQYERPRLLCVGSYEDTACMALLASGYDVQQVDPVLNYDLSTFISRPSSADLKYDVVFSTSVIEHVVDDELFASEIASLLAPGGVAVLTCDFREGYRAGDPMPAEDRRLYTTEDLSRRLLSRMPGCELVDEPSWAGHDADFEYGGCKYSFAAFVVRKT